MEDKRLFLIDAMAMIYRAFFAFSKNPRYNSQKLNTSAIFGFTLNLVDLLLKEKPSHIAVAFDLAEPTFRHIEFPAYKAQREKMPEDLSLSIPYVKRLIEAFNIPVVAKAGFEADDVIGTLAKQAEKEGFQVYMVTPDKDFGQLVSDNIFIFKPSKGLYPYDKWGIAEVCTKYEIKNPMQLTDIIGLWGDASDNIPGIPGIGEVWAKKLIKQFESVENLIENVHLVDNIKMREKIMAFSNQALLSKKLGVISIDAPVVFHEASFHYSGYNKPMLQELFNELEFRTLATRVFNMHSSETYNLKPTLAKQEPDLFSENKVPVIKSEPDLFSEITDSDIENENAIEKANINSTDKKYVLVATNEEIDKLLDLLKNSKSFCFDTETTGLEISSSELVGIAFSVKPFEAYFLTLPPNYGEALEILKRFQPLFEDETIEKIGQNIKFDISMLKNYDINVNGPLFDTMIAHYLIEPDMKHNMDYLADVYLNYKTVPFESLIGKKGKNQLTLDAVEINELKDYACEDADITLQLKNFFDPQLKSNKLTNLFLDVEMPLVKVLSSMEIEGIKIDINILKEISEIINVDISNLEKEIYALAGETFNISSPKQLGYILFDKLEIVKKAKLTKTKQYSTGEEILSKLVSKHEIIQKILDYRSLTKLQSTYIDALPKLIAKRTGRVHSSFNQAVAATGRLSSNNPNLQNIPVRTERGKEIRKAFVPRNENYILLSADYSQIELRLMAELSKDENLIAAFNQGLDIHTATAAKVFHKELHEVTGDLRRIAKTVNFGIMYGISAFGLAERISTISRTEAAHLIEEYFKLYPGIKKYMDDTVAFARQNQYVETILGRKRLIKDINSSNAVVRGYAERNAINAPIQGSAADMIKVAMIQIFTDFNQLNLKSKMILQVHDELVFDVFKPEIETVKQIVANRMKNCMTLSVPLEIEMNTGLNWLEAH